MGEVIDLQERRRERAVDKAIVELVEARAAWLISLLEVRLMLEFEETTRRG